MPPRLKPHVRRTQEEIALGSHARRSPPAETPAHARKIRQQEIALLRAVGLFSSAGSNSASVGLSNSGARSPLGIQQWRPIVVGERELLRCCAGFDRHITLTVWGGKARVSAAPLSGIIRGIADSRACLSAIGTFEGPSNIRLHLTAPRGHCSHAGRGESRGFE